MANMENRKLRVPLTNLANLTLTLHSMIDILKPLEILLLVTNQLWQIGFIQPIWNDF